MASGRRRRRALAASLSILPALALSVLIWSRAAPPPQTDDAPPLEVRFVPAPAALRQASQDEGGSFTVMAPPVPHVTAPVITIATAPSDFLSEAQLAGAMRAGEGPNGGGGGCDMARAVQQALRRDRLVHASVQNAQRLGSATLLWNGDWVRSGAEDGKGLSAVREAITWEVAFAPQACREQRMHGLVLLSLADGRTRFAVGAGEWRWSDLLGLRGR